MAFPTVTIEAAFGSAAFSSSPSWTDISSYARIIGGVRRGRSTNISRVDPTVCDLLLDNRDLRFDPENTSSPYYPNVKPGVRVRISAVYNAVTYRIATGYVQRWPQTYMRPGGGEVKIELRDALARFSGIELPPASYPAELSGTRIGRVLDAIGWPAGDRTLDVGRYTNPAATITAESPTKALAHLLDVADSELGLVFIAGDGKVVYHDLYHRFDTAADYTPAATFGDGGGSELPYEELLPDYDLEGVVNEWRVTPSGSSSAITKEDSSSITTYGRITSSRTPLCADTIALTAQAEFLLAQTKEPRTRFERLVLEPSALADGATKDSVYANALGRELGDRVNVKARPPGGAYTVSRDVYIEGIEHEVSDQRWRTVFRLSPVDPTTAGGGGFWLLGDATYGVLGVTTSLAP